MQDLTLHHLLSRYELLIRAETYSSTRGQKREWVREQLLRIRAELRRRVSK